MVERRNVQDQYFKGVPVSDTKIELDWTLPYFNRVIYKYKKVCFTRLYKTQMYNKLSEDRIDIPIRSLENVEIVGTEEKQEMSKFNYYIWSFFLINFTSQFKEKNMKLTFYCYKGKDFEGGNILLNTGP